MVCFHWSDDSGRVVQKNIDHYTALAQGGPGLIIAEATCVTKDGRLHETQLGLWEDGQVEGFRAIARAVHGQGVPLFVQLHHAGVVGINPTPDCPSDYDHRHGDRLNHGRAMSLARMEELKDAFVKAALRARAAGLDGVELHGCHSYLLSQVLNRNVNRREDKYGQDETLWVREILQAIRDSCGQSFALGIRLAAFEPTLADGLRHAKALAPYVDFLDISYGFSGESTPEKPQDYPYSEAVYGAQEIKKAVPQVPVFCVDGIVSGGDAAGALALSGVDMVDVARGFLVNYNWANDCLAGRDTGRCLHCKPACHWSPFLNDGTVKCPGKTLYLRRQREAEAGR